MLQLQYSGSGTQNIVFWTDTQTTASSIIVEAIDDIRGVTSSIEGTIVSNKFLPEFGGWIVASISKQTIPSGSGQYSTAIYGADVVVPTWANETRSWGQIIASWASYSGSLEKLGDSLSQDRALVSGSDYDTINTYEFQDNSNFTVYNG